MHKATTRFWDTLNSLDDDIQILARKKFELLKTNPKHPSLHFKKLHKYWSVRVGLNHRALAIEDNNDFIWIWIGTHEEYERIVK